MSTLKHTFKNAYAGIPRNIWILAIAMLVNRCGSMVLLYMNVYLTSEKHFSIPQAGVIMSMFGIGSMAGAFVGGKLVDKIGFYKVLYISLFCSGLMLLILGQMDNFYAIAFFTGAVNFFGDAFRPANSASISTYATAEKYTQAIALNRLAMNIGFTIGPIVGGLLAAINYQFLFWADGLTCISAGLFIFLVLPKPTKMPSLASRENEQIEEAVNNIQKSNPYRDKIYLIFIFLTAIYATTFFQFFLSLPLYFKNIYHMPEKQIGWLMACNGIGVATIEMFLIHYIQKRWNQFNFISLGTIMLLLGFAILIPFHGTFVLVIGIIFITLSEMFAMPFMSTYAINKAPKASMGQYMALYSMGWSLAQIISPIMGNFVIAHFGYTFLWMLLGFMSIISFAGFQWLKPRAYHIV